MVELSAFETLAEFAIAQAGFATVVVVLSQGGDDLHPADRFRVLNAIVPPAMAGMLALVLIGLDLFGVSEARLWPALSMLYAACATGLVLYTSTRMRRLPDDARAILSIWIALSNTLVLGGAVLGCLVNAWTPWLGPAHGGFYFFGLVGLLWTGLVAFVRLVFVRPTS